MEKKGNVNGNVRRQQDEDGGMRFGVRDGPGPQQRAERLGTWANDALCYTGWINDMRRCGRMEEIRRVRWICNGLEED